MMISWGSVLIGMIIGGLLGGSLGMVFGGLLSKASMSSDSTSELEVLLRQAGTSLPIGEAIHCQFHICHEKYEDDDDGDDGSGEPEFEPCPQLWEKN